MPGALIHILVGLICAVLVHAKHFKTEYSISIFLGNLLPDALKFGIAMLKIGKMTFQVHEVDIYQTMMRLTNDTTIWYTAGFFIIGLAIFLYHFHIIQKRKMEEYAELWGFLLLGVLIHLLMDAFIEEQGPWL